MYSNQQKNLILSKNLDEENRMIFNNWNEDSEKYILNMNRVFLMFVEIRNMNFKSSFLLMIIPE